MEPNTPKDASEYLPTLVGFLPLAVMQACVPPWICNMANRKMQKKIANYQKLVAQCLNELLPPQQVYIYDRIQKENAIIGQSKRLELMEYGLGVYCIGDLTRRHLCLLTLLKGISCLLARMDPAGKIKRCGQVKIKVEVPFAITGLAARHHIRGILRACVPVKSLVSYEKYPLMPVPNNAETPDRSV